MNFYDFVDRAPDVGTLVFVEGDQRELADRAIAILADRLVPPEARDFNLQRFDADALEDFRAIGDAVQAMPFLGDRRLVIVNGAHLLKADPRRALLAIAQTVPAGNTLAIVDLISPTSKRPVPLSADAGKHALRIDTSVSTARGRATPAADARTRFVTELLSELGVTAEPAVLTRLSRSKFDLSSVRNDLEKLAIGERRITLDAFQRESLTEEDPRYYQFAQAAIEGRAAHAIEIAGQCFEDDRGAAIPLLSALAREYAAVWDVARQNGRVPAAPPWRQQQLRDEARSVGAARARLAFELAVGTFEAIVTGKAGGDPQENRTLVERIAVALSGSAGRPRTTAPGRARRT